SSSRPGLPGGLGRESRCRCACAARSAGGGAIASRSLESRCTGRPPFAPFLDDERQAGHHQDDSVADGGETLVGVAQKIAEPETGGGVGVDAEAHLVRNEREVEG